jgi:hypothetical protein
MCGLMIKEFTRFSSVSILAAAALFSFSTVSAPAAQELSQVTIGSASSISSKTKLNVSHPAACKCGQPAPCLTVKKAA